MMTEAFTAEGSTHQKRRRSANRGRLPDGQPHPVDVHVGGRIRLGRTLRGLSQEELGRKIDLTFQQIQKYEHGTNRISASRIVALANALDLPVSFFFDCLDDIPSVDHIRPPDPAQSGIGTRETTDMMRAYTSIGDESIRRKVYELTKALAKENP